MRIAVRISAPLTTVDGRYTADGFVERARRADAYGFDRISVGDTQLRNMECFTAIGLLATETKYSHLGPGITNPVTRDVGVMANILTSLDVVSDGRMYCLIGRGDGAVRNAGLRPATVNEMRSYFIALRDLLDTGHAVYGEREIRLPWAGTHTRRIPLYLVAEGPRMLRMAGEIADGVFVGAGLLPDIVEESLGRIHEGAKSVGRNPTDLDIWWDTRSGIGPTTRDGMHRAAESIASAGNHALSGGLDGKNVPRQLHDHLAEYHERFDYSKKGDSSQNSPLMEELGLTNYFVERFGVVGTPAEIVDRLRQLESIGVTQVSMASHDRGLVDIPDSIQLLGEDVLPFVR
jgi:5,10-methylenetetrahydromethanopterin reductase